MTDALVRDRATTRPAPTPLAPSPATSGMPTPFEYVAGSARSRETPRRAASTAREADQLYQLVAKVHAQPDEIGWAYEDLQHALTLARERGESVPCQSRYGDQWTSDDAEEQQAAADLCLLCPIFTVCQRYADLAKPSGGTWAGVTRDPPADTRGGRVRVPGMCWKGLHDITAPGTRYFPPSGGSECLACRQDRNAARQAERARARRLVDTPGAVRDRGRRVAMRARDCTCGCGGTTKGGRYLPGHDSQHLGALIGDVRAGELTLDEAVGELAESPRLQAKLTHYLA